MEIFVANLRYYINAEKLINWFAQFGPVRSAKVIAGKNGRSKGFGFVEISGETAGQRAIDVLNGIEIDSREVIVKAADHQPQDQHPGHKRPRNHRVLVASSLKAKIPVG